MQKPTYLILVRLLLFLSIASCASAQDEMQFPVQEFVLSNGMTFLVVERETAPVFAGFISVAAGAANEKVGDIGTAHLLEHMISKGSQIIGTSNYAAEKDLMTKEDSVWARIDRARREERYIKVNSPEKAEAHGKYIDTLEAILDSITQQSSQYVVQNEFDVIYTRNGAAEFNAVTEQDFTSYFVSLPSNRLELFFALESDRFKHMVLREFFPERDVVSEERRLSVENSPDAKIFEQLIGEAYIAHPYGIFWEWQSEENNLSRADIQNFFDTYYIPQNITVAIVGDVKLDTVKKLAAQYFGDIQAGPEPEPIYVEEPVQTGERRLEILFDANPIVSIAYHKSAFDSPDEPSFQVIEQLLGRGRSSRLYKGLVLDKQLCSDISVYTYPGNGLGDKYTGLLCIDAYPKDGIGTGDVEKAVYEELEKLATVPVDERELSKIKNNIDAGFVWAAYSNPGLAWNLGAAQNLAHDWKYLVKYRNNLKAVTAQDIMKTAGAYLTPQNRTVATLVPKKEGTTQ